MEILKQDYPHEIHSQAHHGGIQEAGSLPGRERLIKYQSPSGFFGAAARD